MSPKSHTTSGECRVGQDELQVALTLRGQRSAFDELVRRYEGRLLGFLLQRTRNHADAEDALQQAFVKAYLNLAKYQPSYRFSTWLFTIAARELVSLQRKIPPEAHPKEQDLLIRTAPSKDPSEPVGLWALARRLLGADHYVALWLRYAEDMSVGDIAAVLGRSRVWVKVSLLRARRLLGENNAVKGQVPGYALPIPAGPITAGGEP